jgi:V-type H+-transporting ATPase subunit d
MRDIIGEVSIDLMKSQATKKLSGEWQFFMTNSYEPLTSYLRLCQIPYMIDNVVNIINGIKNKEDPKLLIESCHPMGYIDELKQLAQMDNTDYSLIY